MSIRVPITFESAKEKEKIEKLAEEEGLSLSNYIRLCLGLKVLTHGGARQNAGRPNPSKKSKNKKPD